jgi:hypothetical protein
MPLSPQQIDRYSRQIIVPGMGGRAQERLLASRLVLVGERRDIEPALPYLVGAGVGTIELAIADDRGIAAELANSMRGLNIDVTVVPRIDESHPAPDVVLASIGSDGSLGKARAVLARFPRSSWVIARIDSPPRIAILPSPPPCPRCAGGVWFSRPGNRADGASVVAIAATVEAFKLLAGYAKDTSATIIDFDGYESHSSRAVPDPNCECAKTGA